MNKRTLLNLIGFVALCVVIYFFALHGIKALLGKQGLVTLTMVVGFSEPVARILVRLVGAVDLLVVVGILYWRRPFIVAYAALWPLVPAILVYIKYCKLSFSDLVVVPIAALVVLFTLYRR